MIRHIFFWIKTHKLSSVFIAIAVIFATNAIVESPLMYSMRASGESYGADPGFGMRNSFPTLNMPSMGEVRTESYANDSVKASGEVKVSERITSKSYALSLVSKSTSQTASTITKAVESLGGFVVSSSSKDFKDSESGYITARVPAEKSAEFLKRVKASAQKIVTQDENISDITDQYTDTKENLRILENTKKRIEEVWTSATKTEDMLMALREMQNIQREIDNLKGQERYYEELARYSLFSISISKDEMDVPYMPSEVWNAEYVFRSAVRELVRTARGFATSLIWLAVFAVIWVPVFGVGYILVRKFGRKLW